MDRCLSADTARARQLAPRRVIALLPKPGPTLTQREVQVLQLLAAGCTDKVIPDRLLISVSSVRHHVWKARRRLEAATRTEAIYKAARSGLALPPGK